MRGVSCRALRLVSPEWISWPAERRRETISREPRLAARWREVLDLLEKSGLVIRVGWLRMRRFTRTGFERWIARRRRVGASILGEGGGECLAVGRGRL